ncbi:GIN domain-containing protein [Nannocystis pusilla]|uniref:GIN domain-containing protein n=1 Tax=Nannocystis pusilla TaxID=889268 RepID=UPI003B7D474D
MVEERALHGFDAVHNTTSLAVEIAFADEDGVRVVCDSNLVDDIETYVDVDVLWIDSRGVASLRPRGDCRVEVDIRRLHTLENSGSGHVEVLGEATELTQILHQGAGGLVVEELTASAVEVRSTSSGDVRLGGQVRDLSLDSAGSGGISVRELAAEAVVVRSRGSSVIETTASELIDVQLTGSGVIHVWGEPGDRDIDQTGSGQVVFTERSQESAYRADQGEESYGHARGPVGGTSTRTPPNRVHPGRQSGQTGAEHTVTHSLVQNHLRQCTAVP